MIKVIKLRKHEHIVAVVPERHAGQGWSSASTWVFIQASDGSIRLENIQPDESTLELRAMHEAGEALQRALIKAVPVAKDHDSLAV